MPVLTAADLCTDHTNGARKDLLEWVDAVFVEYGITESKRDRAARVLCQVITERFGQRVTCLWTFVEYLHKHRRPGLAWQAGCWNEAMARLGYTVAGSARADPGKA